jgi:hypothetical protein
MREALSTALWLGALVFFRVLGFFFQFMSFIQVLASFRSRFLSGYEFIDKKTKKVKIQVSSH